MDGSIDQLSRRFVAEFRELFNQRLRTNRVSITALAARLNVGKSSLYAYRRGTTLPGRDLLIRILIALAVPQAEVDHLVALRDSIDDAAGVRPARADSLPVRGRIFVGRRDELAELDEQVRAGRSGSLVRGTLIFGQPGLGKTSLAIEFATSRADQFANGCVYVDADGYSAMLPRSLDSILEALLLQLGLDVEALPEHRGDRISLYRRRISSAAYLIIVDNVRDADVVRALMPNSGGSHVVAIARESLPGLSVDPGVASLGLEPLSAQLSAQLVGAWVNDRRSTVELAMFGGNPLALTVFAAMQGHGLADSPSSLDAVVDGFDVRTSLGQLVAQSVRVLSVEAQATLTAVVSLPSSFPVSADLVGALVPSHERPADTLRELAAAQLISPWHGEAYAVHELLHTAVSSTLAEADLLTAAVRHRACEQALRHMTGRWPADGTGTDTIGRHAFLLLLQNLQSHNPRLVLDAAVAAAEAWIDHGLFVDGGTLALSAATAANLVGNAGQEARMRLLASQALERMGRYKESAVQAEEAVRLAREIADLELDLKGAMALGRIGLLTGDYEAAAKYLDHVTDPDQTGVLDPVSQARAWINRGITYERLGQHRVAADHYRHGLRVARDAPDERLEFIAWANLGAACERLGDLEAAEEAHSNALALSRKRADNFGIAVTSANLGVIAEARGDFHRALELARQAHEMSLLTEDQLGVGSTLINMGEALRSLGQLEAARDHATRGLAVVRELESAEWTVQGLVSVALSEAALGRREEAHDRALAAVGLCERTGDQALLARARGGLAAVQLAQGAFDEAYQEFTRALAEATSAENAFDIATALYGIAQCHVQMGAIELAREHFEQAAVAFDALGASRRADAARARAGGLPA